MKTIVPISGLFGSILPSEWISPLGDGLRNIGVNIEASHFDWNSKGIITYHVIHILAKVEFEFPLIPGSSIELEGDDSGIGIEIITYPVFQVTIKDISLTFLFSSDFLKAFLRDGEQWVEARDADDEPIGFSIDLVLPKLCADASGNISLESPDISLANSAFMIGDTGVLLDFSEDSAATSSDSPLQLIFEEASEDLVATLPVGFRGIWIRRLRVFYIKEGSNLPSLTFERAALGSGGFSGIVGLGSSVNTERTFTEEQLNSLMTNADGIWVGEIEGMRVILLCFNVEFFQSLPISSLISGYIFMPFAEKWLRLEASLGGPNGDFMMEVGGAGDEALIDLDNEFFQIEVDTLRYELRDEIHFAVLSGTVRPKIAGFDWPKFKVQRLAISSNGDIDLDGGWVDVPETMTLDFHGFKIDVNQIGMGSDPIPEDAAEGATPRQWFGFSGGIRLVEGIPLSASVQGLKVSWDPELPPTPEDPLRGVLVSLEGIGVHLEIPNTLVLDGSVRYREIQPPADHIPSEETSEDGTTPAQKSGVFGHLFTGSVTIELTALRTSVSGELMIGDLNRYWYDESGNLQIGEKFTAFYIVLDVGLPAALPLGATGTGLYGLTGLFGMHVAPDRALGEGGEPQSWYLWYKLAKGGVQSTAYNVTKVVKWTPQFDHYAFGAGLTLGTIYDDGFTINAGALVVILIPGPVIMIEGRANLIKPRGEGGGREAEGALYALIVFDGLANTFSINVDINFSLEDLITVGGGLEAFFDFEDDSKWYIYIGRKEPEEKRIRAEVLSIVTASAYFMIDPTAIQFGAKVGLDINLEYGPLVIRLILRLRFEIGLFFNHPQLTGLIELYGEITIKIFGIGLSLILQTLLEGSAPQPWWIHGLARVAMSLPFPLPSFDVQVEFTWGESGLPATVDLIKGASAIHPKEIGKSWELSETVENAPIIPVDALPLLRCAKPLSMVSSVVDESGISKPFSTETVEGWEFGYDLTAISLHRLNEDEGGAELIQDYQPAADAVYVPEEGPFSWQQPWLAGGHLYPNASDNVQEPQVVLWGYSPIPGAPHRKLPCIRGQQQPLPIHCVNWSSLPGGTTFQPVFQHAGLTFAAGLGSGPASIVDQLTGTLTSRGLKIGVSSSNPVELTIRFPEPVVYLRILTLDGSPSFSAYYLWIPSHTPPDGPVPNPYIIEGITTTVVIRAPGPLVIGEICYRTQRDVQQAEWNGSMSILQGETAFHDQPLLEPNGLYRIDITGRRRGRRVGESAFNPVNQDKSFYFRTAELPGFNLTSEAINQVRTEHPEALDPRAESVDFRDGALNRLETFVARSVPSNGARFFYRGYDVLVEFSDPYVRFLYGDRLKFRLLDRNGKVLLGGGVAEDSPIRWLDSGIPWLTSGLLKVFELERKPECRDEPLPWESVSTAYLACTLPETLKPGRMYRVELMGTVAGKEQLLYGFEFATSRYATITEHLKSGLEARTDDGDPAGRRLQITRLGLPPIAAPDDIDWFDGEEYDRLSNTFREARRQLSNALAGMAGIDAPLVPDAIQQMETARSELQAFCYAAYKQIDDSVLPSFSEKDMGHRPFPPQVELVRVQVQGEPGCFLLLESPEPLEWERLKITYDSETVIYQPARILWNEDGTRAFIFSFEEDGKFSSGGYDFTFKVHRGGSTAYDLDPFYQNGSLDPEEPCSEAEPEYYDTFPECIRWRVELD